MASAMGRPASSTASVEGQVDARRDPGGGGVLAVAHVRGRRPGPRRARPGARAPPSGCWRGGRGGARRRRAAARRCTPTPVIRVVCVDRAQPGQDPGVALERAGAEAAGHDQEVGGGDLVDRRAGDQGEPAVVGRDRAARGRGERDLGAGQPGQDLVGADRVERGQAVEQEEDDLHGGASIVGGRRRTARGTRAGPGRRRGRTRGAGTRACRSRRPRRRRRSTAAWSRAGGARSRAGPARRRPPAAARPRPGRRARSGARSSRRAGPATGRRGRRRGARRSTPAGRAGSAARRSGRRAGR